MYNLLIVCILILSFQFYFNIENDRCRNVEILYIFLLFNFDFLIISDIIINRQHTMEIQRIENCSYCQFHVFCLTCTFVVINLY